jgi:benzoyl-CoA reductase subunit B
VTEGKRYPTEPLKCWDEAKYLRKKYYEDYLKAPETGGLRVSGSATMFFCIPAGLGEDVYYLTGEPYAASVASREDFCATCLESVERAGIARDLCSYMRDYWGSLLVDKYILADGTILDGWPKPDFQFSSHFCCTHAKWYQYAGELEGNIPTYVIDNALGYHRRLSKEREIDYFVEQIADSIEWMEKVTGREYNDELLIEAVENEIRSETLWPEIMMYQQTIPAPLEEKTMFSLYLFNSLCPHKKEIVDFYERLLDEVKDRVKRGIAAAPIENFRLFTDSQPPWAFLQLWRYLQNKFGVVSVGNPYLFWLQTLWEEGEDGKLMPARNLKQMGVKPKNREEAIRAYAERRVNGYRIGLATFVTPHIKSEMMKEYVKDWHVDGVLIHLNRGCEGSALGQMENRLALLEANIPVLTYEGSVGDFRDFDLARTSARIDAWFEGLGIKQLSN